jgi:lipopolysaccharide/colanic/teichoic acid biosynthesis glycosyltransferase
VGATTGGFAQPHGGTGHQLAGTKALVGVAPQGEHAPDVHHVDDDVVIDLRTGEPVVGLRTVTPATPGKLNRAPRWKLGLKRAMDVVCASVALALLAPVFLIVATAIWVTSPGPIFFTQSRVGRNGEVFRFRKFRTMYVNAEAMKNQLRELNDAEGPIFKMRRDPRVTRVGRVLRRMSLDELPQLVHVLSGHMSLVGPRPHLPEEVAAYGPFDYRRLTVQPGITCLREVSGRSELDFETWVALDLEYIDSWSLWLDVKLLFRTVPAVVSGRGAY